jgi:hypothetical protein
MSTLVICIIAFFIVLIMIRLAQINARLKQNEDYLLDCVTKDRLSETIRASILENLK